MKTMIITDSNSGITQTEGAELGIRVLAMPFYIDEELFLEGVTLSKNELFDKLDSGCDVHTSQPSPADVLDLWDEVLKEYDQIIHIPMSSGLSSTCDTATSMARDYDGKVVVVDNGRIAITMKQSVMNAIKLLNDGKTADEIKEILEENKENASIYVTVDSLKFLKKGGRITASAAAIGSVLNIKPVLQLKNKKLDAFAKVRGWKQAKKAMFDALEKDINENFVGKKMQIAIAHTAEKDELDKFVAEVKERFPNEEIGVDDLSLVVATHVGKGVLAVGCSIVL